LDVGCEDGKHVAELQKISPYIYGIDTNPETELPNVIKGSVFEVELPVDLDGTYLLSPFFGDEWNNYEILLRKLNLSLNIGGIVVIDLFNFNSYPVGGGYKDFKVLGEKIILSDYVRNDDNMKCSRTIVFKDWSQKQISLRWKVFSQPELEAICTKTGFKIKGLYLDFDINESCTFEIPKNKKRRVVVLQKL
jgi:hypothetical protein